MGAEQGQVDAQFHVGKVYADGTSVTRDYIQAYMWLALSIDGSTDKRSPAFQEAADLRDSIAKKMTPQQIAEAKRLASEWESSYLQRIGSGPYVGGWGMAPPIDLVRSTPPCTDEAGSKNESAVVFSCIVRKDGTVGSCTTIKGLSYGLESAISLESAINTIETKWRFKPGTIKGKPVDVQIGITFSCLPSQR